MHAFEVMSYNKEEAFISPIKQVSRIYHIFQCLNHFTTLLLRAFNGSAI